MDVQPLSHPRSLSDRQWATLPVRHQPDSVDKLCAALDISRGMANIMAARDLLDLEEAQRFLNPSEDQLHPARLMRDMDIAVERIHQAMAGYEKILVFGDYDVDGTAATTILYNYLKRLGSRVQYLIPHRTEDGYGINPVTVEKFAAWGVDLLITTDHGSTAVEGAQLLKARGIDLIITDHHRLNEERPECVALVNPQQEGCPYPFKELSATGVAYKVAEALDAYLTEQDYWNTRGICHTSPAYYLDLVALATVADMSPLIGENRILVKMGLEVMNRRPRPGLSGLIKECNVRTDVSPSIISFKLAPKINALGKVGDPAIGVRLLLSHSYTEARKLARMLVAVNRERRSIEQEVISLAREQVGEAGECEANVLVGGDWHPGVIGAIAARLSFETRKPTVVLTGAALSSQVVGSARSWDGSNILEALRTCESLLERFGGHPSAAGLSLDVANLDKFRSQFNEAIQDAAPAAAPNQNQLEIESWLSDDMLSDRFFADVMRLSPFGHRNPEPVVAMRGMTVARVLQNQTRHLRFNLRCTDGREIEANAWGRPDWSVDLSGSYDVAFVPQIWQSPAGPRSQLKVVDMIHRA